MEVIIRAVFGIGDPERIAELQRVLPGLSSPNPLLLLVQRDLGRFSPWGRFLRLRDHVDSLLYEEIALRRGEEDLERISGRLPMVGLIPTLSGWRNRKVTHVVSVEEPNSFVAEAYRALRTSIQALVNAALSSGGLLFRKSAHADASVSCRLRSF